MTGISFILSKRKNPLMIISWIIRFIEGTQYSHCAMCIEENGIEYVYESTMPKGRKILKSEWDKIYEPVYSYHFMLTDEQRHDALSILQSIVGKPYSYFQLLLILLELCSSAVKNFIRYLEFNGESRQICTETIAIMLNRVFMVAIPENYDHISLKEARYLLDNTMNHWNDIGYRANRLQYFLKGVK